MLNLWGNFLGLNICEIIQFHFICSLKRVENNYLGKITQS